MEVLLVLAGLGGLAYALQSKPLPSDKDFDRAAERLEKDYDDRRANQTVGMYLAFVEGEFQGAMQYLAKASSSTLRTLAKHEMDRAHTDTPEKQMGMGDEWARAAKSFRALTPIFYDRAAFWYKKAWPKMGALGKLKLRARAKMVALPVRRGGAGKALPTGWKSFLGGNGVDPERDNTVARSGSYSVKLLPADIKIKGSHSVVYSEFVPIDGNEITVSAYVRTDGTENGGDKFLVHFFDNTGKLITAGGPFIPVDFPFWNQVRHKMAIPKGATRAHVGLWQYSKNGNAWIDDISVKVDDGENLLPNPSFEK